MTISNFVNQSINSGKCARFKGSQIPVAFCTPLTISVTNPIVFVLVSKIRGFEHVGSSVLFLWYFSWSLITKCCLRMSLSLVLTLLMSVLYFESST